MGIKFMDVVHGLPVVGDIARGIEAGGNPKYNVDDAAFNANRKRAADLYNSLGAERAGVAPPNAQIGSAAQFDAPTIDMQQATAARASQLQNADALAARGRGEGPSVSEYSYTSKIPAITAGIEGHAGQIKGQAGTVARLEAAKAIGQTQQQAAIDAAMGRAGEAATAAGQATSAYGNVRTADQTLAMEQARQQAASATENARLRQQTSEANQRATLEGTQIANNYKTGLGTQQLQANQQDEASIEAKNKALQEERQRNQERADNAWKSVAQGAAWAFGI